MHQTITIVLPSYKSRKLLLNHIKNISKKIKIIIVDNSNDKKLQKEFKNKFKNVSVLLRKNIGYGAAINFGSKYVKTKYFLVMNPDTKIYKDTIKNLLIAAKKLKVFGAISPDQIENKSINLKKDNIIKQKQLDGGAMLFDKNIFRKIKGFDENIFLYYEENDFYHKCGLLKYDLFLIRNSYFYHSQRGDSSSAIFNNTKEQKYAYMVGGWHGQWSKFYYLKKYNGYTYSLVKCFPNLINNFIKLILNILMNFDKAKYSYFKIEGLICSILGMRSFKRNKYDDFN
jgi:N-acetylglucosaminyl-diphospho-decaprenol L-rhamnosyltransferase